MTKYILPISHSGKVGNTFNYDFIVGPAILYLENSNGDWQDVDVSTTIDPNAKFLLFINQATQLIAGSNAGIVYLDLWFKRALSGTFTPFIYENNFFKFDGKYMHLMYSYNGWNSMYTASNAPSSYTRLKQIFHVYCGVELTLKVRHTLVWEECSTSSNAKDVVLYYPDDNLTQSYPDKAILNKRFTLKSETSSNGVTDPPRRILKYIVFEI
jgi:hypothetical protein